MGEIRVEILDRGCCQGGNCLEHWFTGVVSTGTAGYKVLGFGILDKKCDKGEGNGSAARYR